MSPDRLERRRKKGVLKDVHALHFPRGPVGSAEGFDQGVGRKGYDRHAGVRVPRHPTLRLPGEKRPRAAPFGAEDEDGEQADEKDAGSV